MPPVQDDLRYQALYQTFARLTDQQLRRVLATDPKQMVYDDGNWADGKLCPLAVALGITANSDIECATKILAAGFEPRNLKGVSGEFFRENRARDIQLVIVNLLLERSR